jgi:hypothetical protein
MVRLVLPRDVQSITRLLVQLPQKPDPDWNTIALAPQLRRWWERAVFGLEYIGHSPVPGMGLVEARLRFVWMPRCIHYHGLRRIDLAGQRDRENGLYSELGHVYGSGAAGSDGCVHCMEVQLGSAIESGHTVRIRQSEKDVLSFRTMIEIQWAMVCIGAMSGAAQAPELL